MQKAQIQLDVRTVGRSSAGLVFAGLHLCVNGSAFPHEKWTDFVVVVLAWWAEAALRLLQGEAGPVIVRFMEGPYWVEIETAVSGSWRLRLVESGGRAHVLREVVVECAPLIDSVLEACRSSLDVTRERGWWTQDADALNVAMQRLSARRGSFRDEGGC